MRTWSPKTGAIRAGGQGGDDRHGFQVSLTAPGEPWRRGRLSWGAEWAGPGLLLVTQMLPESTCRKPSCALVLHREECGTAGEGDPWSLRVLLTYLFSHSDQLPRL